MADNWDDDSNVKAKWDEEVASTKKPIKDSWEDEEEEEVKESWEDDDEPKKKEAPKAKETNKAAAGGAKKNPAQPARELTEEEKKQAQLNADLKHTNELFGLGGSLDEFSIASKEDYTTFIDKLFARINIHNGALLYQDFLDDLFKKLSSDIPIDSLRKISNNLRTYYDNRVAEEKANKAKDAKGKKGKGKIKIVRGEFDSFLKDDHAAAVLDDDGDDFI